MSLDAALVLDLLHRSVWPHGDARAAAQLRGLLEAAAVSSLPALDRLARRDLTTSGDVGDVRPSHAALVVLSMVRSGWERAASLRLLEPAARVGDRLSLAAVVLRLDDPQWMVRDHAQRMLARIFVDVDVHALAAVLPVIDALADRQRTDARRVLRLARDRLRAANVRAAATQPPDVQRALRRLHGLADDELGDERLQTALAALRDRDLDLAVAISRVDDDIVRRGLGEAFAAQPAGHLRLRAADLLRDQPAALLKLSVDVRSDVRSRARFLLGETTDEQREYARAAVDDAATEGSGRALLGALASLGEIGRPADFPRIARFLHDERTRVQAEAVRALIGSHASEGVVDYVDVLVDKLTSSSWRVAVEAARGLAWVPAMRLPLGEIREVEPRVHPTVRRLLAPFIEPGNWSV
ncbi:MAG: hypothetical protein Q8O67_33135 [Deltaproteobacteria bacterium]|nr:hypothetical protein [Deltaproteobacteria bacterium]